MREASNVSGLVLLGALACAIAPGCANRSPVDTRSEEEPALTRPAALVIAEAPEARTRLLWLRAKNKLHVVPDGLDGSAPFDREALPAGAGARFELSSDKRMLASFDRVDRDKSRGAATVLLPVHAADPFRVVDEASKLGIEVRLAGAVQSRAQVADGLVLYRAAWQGQFDVVHRPTFEGTEDYVFVESRPEQEELRYEIDASQVGGMRLVGNTLELHQKDGKNALRVAPPYVIDAAGSRQEALIRVEGCAYSTRPAAAPDAKVVTPGERSCTVVISWADADRLTCGAGASGPPCGPLQYPAVVDPAWTTTFSMITARKDFPLIATSIGMEPISYLACGGLDTAWTEINKCEYRSDTSSWYAGTPLLTARGRHTGTVMKDFKILYAGGIGTATAEIYSPSVLTVSAAAPMSTIRAAADAHLLLGGPVMVIGGGTSNAFTTILSSAEWYDPGTNAWLPRASMSTTRLKAASELLSGAGGYVLMAGGSTALGGATAQSTAEYYNPGNNTWTATAGVMTSRRYKPGSAYIAATATLIAGGLADTTALSTAEIYNANTKTFTATGSMATARQMPIGLLLQGPARVLMPSGKDASGAVLMSSELFIQATGKWVPAGNLAAGRAIYGIAPFGIGGAIVAGGEGSSPTLAALATSEILSLDQGTACINGDTCASGSCVDGFCCNEACTSLCKACSNAKSGGANGYCALVPSRTDPDNECSTAPNFTCNGNGACASGCDADADCGTGYYCTGTVGTCTAKKANGTACPGDVLDSTGSHSCTTGFCVDGVCCSAACTGLCQACVSAKTGGTTGTCTNNPNYSDPDNECQTGPNLTCNGSGACGSSCNAAANCGSAYYCSANPGTCTAKKSNGSACATFAFDATGNTQCTSGFCLDGVCCENACGALCMACSSAKTGQANGLCKPVAAASDPDNECSVAPNLNCNGSGACAATCNAEADCGSGYYCSGNPGSCVAKKATGAACASYTFDTTGNGQCTNAHCVDGVCCDTACSALCMACTAAKTGGTNGTCKGVANATDPENECSTAPSFTCNGSGACGATCTLDTSCGGGTTYYCNGGTCAAKLAPGAVCTTLNQCLSGICVDGRCCQTACNGTCQACANTSGTCTNYSAYTDPVDECTHTCNGNGACWDSCTLDTHCASNFYCNTGTSKCTPKIANGQKCTVAGQCSSGNCVDTYCCNTACGAACDACNGLDRLWPASPNGTCSIAPNTYAGDPSCSNHLRCSGTTAACLASCSTDANCDAGYYCSGTTCVQKKGNGVSCTAGTQCSSTFCVDSYCCDDLCGAKCQACNVSGNLGVCTTFAAYSDPENECPNTCNGSTACWNSCINDTHCSSGTFCQNNTCSGQKPNGSVCGGGNECASGKCVDSTCCDEVCTGTCQACNIAPSAGVCTTYSAYTDPDSECLHTCSGGASCWSDCKTDGDCGPGYYCSGTTCAAKQVNGNTCTAANECANGNCVDGVCCDTPCSATCQACSQPGNLGTCTTFTAFTDPGDECTHTCSGGTSCWTTCVNDTHCASGHYCKSGDCVVKEVNGAACSANVVCASNNCVDGVCCDTACNGQCDACDGATKGWSGAVNGTCAMGPNGFAGEPACPGQPCIGASADCEVICTTDTECVNGFYCDSAGKCKAQKSQGMACDPKAGLGCLEAGCRICSTNNCVDNVCCDTPCAGACDECVSQGGKCAFAAKGSPGDPQCAPFTCTGGSDTCPSSCSSDAECVGPSYCDAGVCKAKKAAGLGCVGSNECLDNACLAAVCCDALCNGACEACGIDGHCALISGQGSAACGGYKCDGATASCPTSCLDDNNCLASHYCAGGACLPRVVQGQPCGTGTQCVSGFCADGVCCDTACSGLCEACSQAAKGGGVDGACGPVAAGSDPHSNCEDLGPSQCLRNGRCDGAGQCANYAAGTECGATDCVDDKITQHRCGAATCQPTTLTDCRPYKCSAAQCLTSCIDSNDCAPGHVCETGSKTCKAKSADGTKCTDGATCTNGHCVDGTCCNSACIGQCQACDLPSALGTCSPVTGAPRGSRPKCAAAATNDPCSARACNGEQSTTECLGYVAEEVECRALSCTLGVQTFAAKCDGAGKCKTSETKQCSPYVCGDKECKSTCKTDTDCIKDTSCDTMSGNCVVSAVCDGDHTVTSTKGASTDCSPYKCEASGQCRGTCSSSAQCIGGFVCDTVSSQCVTAAVESTDSGGCGCRTAPRSSQGPWALLALASLGVVATRRRRRARAM
jgi:MYXO-CTERM domain-containing protein